jgi:hypothetical protein
MSALRLSDRDGARHAVLAFEHRSACVDTEQAIGPDLLADPQQPGLVTETGGSDSSAPGQHRHTQYDQLVLRYGGKDE